MADLGHQLTDQQLKELEKRIAAEYKQAEKDVEKKLRDYLQATEAGRAKQEALLKAGKITQKEYSDWCYRHAMVGKRWEEMKEVLASDYHNANQIALKIAGEEMPNVYALNANYATYQIEKLGNIDTGFTLYNHDTAEYLLSEEQSLMPGPSTRKAREIAANKDMQWNMQHIQSAVLQGVLQGEPAYKVAERLRSVGQMNYNASVRYARTMITNAQNAGRYQSYRRCKNLGVELTIEWQATLDGRTRHSHRMMHGQRREVDEPFEIDGFQIMWPGNDKCGTSTVPQQYIWNCRCTLIGLPKGFEGDTVKESEYLKQTGQSFEEWQNDHAQKISSTVLIGGKNDPELTDSIRDYYLPKGTRDNLQKIESLHTYDDFEKYFAQQGIELDTGLEKLKTEYRYATKQAVEEELQKIATAVDAYKNEFGEDALSKLKKIVVYDDQLDTRAAYFFNRIGENDPLAGSIHFKQWGDSGHTIFHELAHAYQDSHALIGEDAVLYAERMVKAANLPESFWAYTGAAKEVYDAERFADAFAYAFTSKGNVGKQFVQNVAEQENLLKKSGFTSKTKPATINLPDIPIGRSVGAKRSSERILDLETGNEYDLANGTFLRKVEVFAGKGTSTPYNNAWKYADKFHNDEEEWQHVKGIGTVATDDGDRDAELHWSQCEEFGRVDMFVKKWLGWK